MKTHGISQLPVLESDGRLIGLVSEVKVLNSLVKGEVTMKSPVGPLADINDAAMVERDTPITTLSAHFAQGKIAVVMDRATGQVPQVAALAHQDRFHRAAREVIMAARAAQAAAAALRVELEAKKSAGAPAGRLRARRTDLVGGRRAARPVDRR